MTPPAGTVGFEIDLYHALVVIVRTIVAYARSEVVIVAKEERDRFHAKDDVGRNARSVIEGMRAEAARAEAIAAGTSRTAIEKEASRHTKKWTAVVGAQAQIDVSLLLRDDDLVDLLSVRSEEFNRLIKNLSTDVLNRIERETLSAIFEGKGNNEIAKALQDIEGIGRRRARLIARDQAAKLNSAMNEFRQSQAGITHFKWKTILDGRERPAHHAKNGKVYPWAGPHEKPGQAINCRCRALAILVDDEETASQIVGPDPDPIDLETAIPKIEAGAALYRSPLASLDRETLLLKKAEFANVRTSLETLRASSAVSERDAERLFQSVFGFPSEGQDLARMIGTRLVTGRRAQLFAAMKARLNNIDEMLEHAAETASATATARAPDPLARKFPTGKHFERIAGEPIGLAEATAKGRDFTMREGKRTGHEWALVHDEQGRVLAVMSSGQKGFVDTTASGVPELYTAGNRVSFHHNHPMSTSFSVADIGAFEWAHGMRTIHAHGHDGSTYALTVRQRRGIKAKADAAHAKAERDLRKAVTEGRMTVEDWNKLHAHVRALILAARGHVGYTYTLSGPTKAAAERSRNVINGIIASAGTASTN